MRKILYIFMNQNREIYLKILASIKVDTTVL